jgi:hypothetical protein
MKVSSHATKALEKSKDFRAEVPILSLIPDESEMSTDHMDPAKICKSYMYSNPADTNSIKIRFDFGLSDGTQSVRFQLAWIENVYKALLGMNMTTGPLQHNMVKQFCKGQVWTCYNESIIKQQQDEREQRAVANMNALVHDIANNETQAEFDARKLATYETTATQVVRPVEVAYITNALKATVKLVCPYKALEKQKRFMRRKMRKPADMKTRMYVNYLNRINYDELPNLPPFAGVVQSLSQDEMMDIILFGIPKSWITEMDKQDFDPFSKTIERVVDFCERMESAENFTPVAMKKQSTASPAKKVKFHKAQGKSSGGNGDKWCEYHESSTHNTSECTVLNKLKASKKNNSSDKKPSAKKDWKSKSNDAKKFTTKELNAIVKKKVKQAKKEVNAVAKRKSDDDDNDSDSVSSLHMLENRMHDIDEKLKHFDFDKANLDKSADC